MLFKATIVSTYYHILLNMPPTHCDTYIIGIDFKKDYEEGVE